MRYMIAHWNTLPWSYKVIAYNLRTRHPWSSWLRWIISDEIFILDTPACRLPYPRYLPSPTLWVSPVAALKMRRLVIIFLWVLPFHNGWMSNRTSFKARAVWGKPTVLPYAKGHYPRFPALSTGRYLHVPVDADTLFTWPRAPPSWYQVCSTQGNPVPSALHVLIKEISAAGCDLAVISELDWLTSGASHLLGQLAVSSLHVFHNAVTALCVGDM